MPRRLAITIGVVAALGLGAAAQAQNPQPGPPGQTPPPVTPPGPTTTPPDQIAPRTDPSLSDTLSRNRGVLTPPAAVDPGITQAPPRPATGTMPVIPPPGTPGGKPGVVPK